MSLDPLTEGGRGYPLLFQSGESWHDEPLHDRQHPHDLFDEIVDQLLAEIWRRPWRVSRISVIPANRRSGPPTFMHRTSAMDDPDAPLGHHWQDSTHVTFGVAHMRAWFGATVKVEGSIFTGREPDEDRYNFDQPDSIHTAAAFPGIRRKTWPCKFRMVTSRALKLSTPMSIGHRTTASIIYNQPVGRDSNWSNSLCGDQNNDSGEGRRSRSCSNQTINAAAIPFIALGARAEIWSRAGSQTAPMSRASFR